MQIKAVLGDNSFFHQKENEVFLQIHEKMSEMILLKDQNQNFTEEQAEYQSLLMDFKNILNNKPELVNKQDPNFKVTLLHAAAGSGLLELVKIILEFKPNLKLTNCFGQTAAQRARQYARREDIAKLIESHDHGIGKEPITP